MSTIKSSDEHLTLNADGSSKDIKFQANGVEKASISSAGAFTSTTIDATKLTGDLPAISGANLTGVGVSGITSSADATAITIDSSENVGIGTGSPTSPLHVLASSAGQTVAKFESNQAGSVKVAIDADADRDGFLEFQEAGTKRWDFWMNGSSGTNQLKIRNESGDTRFELTQNGTARITNTVLGSRPHYGGYTITITGLTTLTGNSWKQYGLRVVHSGITGGASDAQVESAILGIRGLSSWTISSTNNIVGSISASASSSSSTGIAIAIGGLDAYNQGQYFVELFANDGAAMSLAL
jgi:hypothetical protein